MYAVNDVCSLVQAPIVLFVLLWFGWCCGWFLRGKYIYLHLLEYVLDPCGVIRLCYIKGCNANGGWYCVFGSVLVGLRGVVRSHTLGVVCLLPFIVGGY